MVPVIILPIIVVGVLFLLFLILRQQENLEATLLQTLATKRGGQLVKKGPFLSALKIPLRRYNIYVQVGARTQQGGPYLLASSPTSLSRSFEAFIYPDLPKYSFAKSVRLIRDTDMDNPAFDRAYVVSCNDLATLQRLVHSELQQVLIEVAERAPSFRCRESELCYYEQQTSNNLDDVQAFVERAIRIFSECEEFLADRREQHYSTLLITTVGLCIGLAMLFRSLLRLFE